MFIARKQLGGFCLSLFSKRGRLEVIFIFFSLFSENLLQIFFLFPIFTIVTWFQHQPQRSLMLQHFWSYKLQIYLGFRVMSSLEFQFEFGNQVFFYYLLELLSHNSNINLLPLCITQILCRVMSSVNLRLVFFCCL